jgi:polyisoprenoid-binding protein YceI
MKNLFYTGVMALACTTLMASNLPEGKANKYSTRAMEASIIWTGGKITGGSHTGTLTLMDNSLEFIGKDLAGGSFTIDMNSITTTDLSGESADRLIGHLKSDDFFGVSSYPTSSFTITRVESGKEPGTYEVTGDLTIKATTLPIRFTVNMEWESNLAIATANLTVNRADYDVRFGSGRFFDDLGNRAIKDEFTLDVRIISEVSE